MLRWLGKMLLFRILPRKLLPVITVIEVVRFLRNARKPGTAEDRRPVRPVAGTDAARGGRAAPGGLGLPSLRAEARAPRVVGRSGPDVPAARGGGATVPR